MQGQDERPLLLVDGKTNSLDGNRTVGFTTWAMVMLAKQQGQISKEVFDQAAFLMLQEFPHPDGLLIGRVLEGETPADALKEIYKSEAKFWQVHAPMLLGNIAATMTGDAL